MKKMFGCFCAYALALSLALLHTSTGRFQVRPPGQSEFLSYLK